MISIIIPAYNEEERIEKTLVDYINFFRDKKIDFEILVILNGCKDNTIGIVKKYGKYVRYKNYPESIGKGKAVIEGFKYARGEEIAYVDADGATSPIALYDLYARLNNFDGVIGSRWIRGAKITVRQPWKRRIASRILNKVIRIILRLEIYDSQCGAKIFKKHAIDNIIDNNFRGQWGFDIEILYRLMRGGYLIKEVPTIWEDKRGSKLCIWKVAPKMFWTIIKLKFEYGILRKFKNER